MLLITGITGRSGKYFLQELINNKYEGSIRCIVRKGSDTSMLDRSGLNVEKVTIDLDDQSDFRPIDIAMFGVETVVHISSIRYSETILMSAIKNNVTRFICVHTTGIFSKYKSAAKGYRNIELSMRNIVKDSNSQIGVVYLRPTMIFGSINDHNMIVFIKMVDNLRLFPVINNGINLLQPVNTRDLGKAYYQILCCKNIVNGDYILSGERPIEMIEILKIISEFIGKRTIFFNVPLPLAIFMASLLKLCTFGKVDFVERVMRMGEDRHFTHEDAERDFGYKSMPFADGLKIEVDQYIATTLSR